MTGGVARLLGTLLCLASCGRENVPSAPGDAAPEAEASSVATLSVDEIERIAEEYLKGRGLGEGPWNLDVGTLPNQRGWRVWVRREPSSNFGGGYKVLVLDPEGHVTKMLHGR